MNREIYEKINKQIKKWVDIKINNQIIDKQIINKWIKEKWINR